MTKLHAVKITWNDAVGRMGWKYRDEAARLPLMPIQSVGYLVKHGKRRTVICQDYCQSVDTMNGIEVIPTSSIIKIKTLS